MKTKSIKPVTYTSEVIREPIAPCEILLNGLAGSIIINEVGYAISINGELSAVGEPIIYGYTLTKEDGTSYDVGMNHGVLTCDCPDQTFNRDYRDPRGCKHCQVVRRHFQLPVELNS